MNYSKKKKTIYCICIDNVILTLCVEWIKWAWDPEREEEKACRSRDPSWWTCCYVWHFGTPIFCWCLSERRSKTTATPCFHLLNDNDLSEYTFQIQSNLPFLLRSNPLTQFRWKSVYILDSSFFFFLRICSQHFFFELYHASQPVPSFIFLKWYIKYTCGKMTF